MSKDYKKECEALRYIIASDKYVMDCMKDNIQQYKEALKAEIKKSEQLEQHLTSAENALIEKDETIQWLESMYHEAQEETRQERLFLKHIETIVHDHNWVGSKEDDPLRKVIDGYYED